MQGELIIKIEQNGNAHIEIDNKKIGLIQNLRLELSSDNHTPNCEITFPNIPEDSKSPVKERVREYIETAKKLPYCVIQFKPVK